MIDVRQYQEHHYCKNNDCNAHVMLGDGAEGGEGEGGEGGDGEGGDGAGSTIFSFVLLIGAIL